MDFAVPADHTVKIKESKKIHKYLELDRDLKQRKAVEHEGDCDRNKNCCCWNGPKSIGRKEVEINRSLETILTTALLRSARILRRVREF